MGNITLHCHFYTDIMYILNVTSNVNNVKYYTTLAILCIYGGTFSSGGLFDRIQHVAMSIYKLKLCTNASITVFKSTTDQLKIIPSTCYYQYFD